MGGARLHDMRHRSAASTLVAWYRAGRDTQMYLHQLNVLRLLTVIVEPKTSSREPMPPRRRVGRLTVCAGE